MAQLSLNQCGPAPDGDGSLWFDPAIGVGLLEVAVAINGGLVKLGEDGDEGWRRRW